MTKLLVNSYIFYEENYKNIFNILIHVICIPIFLWTNITLFSYISYEYKFIDSQSILLQPLKLNMSSVITSLYIIYYSLLDYKLIKLWFLLFSIICYTANLYNIKYPNNGLLYCVYLFISTLTIQILSQKYIENSKQKTSTIILKLFTVIPFLTILMLIFGLFCTPPKTVILSLKYA